MKAAAKKVNFGVKSRKIDDFFTFGAPSCDLLGVGSSKLESMGIRYVFEHISNAHALHRPTVPLLSRPNVKFPLSFLDFAPKLTFFAAAFIYAIFNFMHISPVECLMRRITFARLIFWSEWS